MIILGVDCGLGGALGVLDTATKDIVVWDMPTFTIKRGKSMRRDLDGHSLHRLIDSIRPGHAFVEKAQAQPRWSAYATGIFFQSYGETRGILISNDIPFEPVDPAKWKKALGVPAGKDGARAKASQLMPSAADQWPLKKHDGRAEACLIALYGALLLRGIANGLPASNLLTGEA